MKVSTNANGQPIGEPVSNWRPVSLPPRSIMEGRFCHLEPIDIDRHGCDLFEAFRADGDHRNWTYLPYGPFEKEVDFQAWMSRICLGDDPLFHAIMDAESDRAVGVASYLRIEPGVGVIETGHLHYSPHLQRRPAATEAMFLMMRRVFSELGYRRYEWKCDALNAPSRKAAERLGFRFEGVFRQATVYKGRNRDTAWYSILDKEWPLLAQAFSAWLDPVNFDGQGRQKASLAALITKLRHAEGT